MMTAPGIVVYLTSEEILDTGLLSPPPLDSLVGLVSFEVKGFRFVNGLFG